MSMDVEHKLRNSLIRKIQKLSAKKLVEINSLFGKLENQFKATDKTLKFAGTWKDIDKELFVSLTDKLHENRATDRQIFNP